MIFGFNMFRSFRPFFPLLFSPPPPAPATHTQYETPSVKMKGFLKKCPTYFGPLGQPPPSQTPPNNRFAPALCRSWIKSTRNPSFTIRKLTKPLEKAYSFNLPIFNMYLVFEQTIAESSYPSYFCREHPVICKYILQNYKGIIEPTWIHIDINLEDNQGCPGSIQPCIMRTRGIYSCFVFPGQSSYMYQKIKNGHNRLKVGSHWCFSS